MTSSLPLPADTLPPIPGLPGREVPYLIEAGDGRKLVSMGQVTRVLASGIETGGEIAVTGLQSPEDDKRIPPHFHEPRAHAWDGRTEPVALAQHDFSIILRGRVQSWVGDQSRILSAGDIVSIPPGTPHSSRLLTHGTELLAPVFPAGWVRFLETMGTPYDGSAYPRVDESVRHGPEVFRQMVAEGLLTPMPDYPFPATTYDDADDTIPDEHRPYFLRSGNGPRHEAFGQVAFQVLPGSQSDGRMGVTITEGPTGTSVPTAMHAGTYRAIFVMEGRMSLTVGGESYELGGGDFFSIPKGTPYSYALRSAFTRFASIVAPAGIERLFEIVGEVSQHKIFPSRASDIDPARLEAAAEQLDVTFIDEG